ncbi:hypothetical protein Zmor_026884 [Zophobas morio]|uniref:Uncharacterized protein n=1 Tax=Zophobas morio TaxID=2755281 RepID=A0AA38M5X1_9CUCU|nr:hypothetical protein Zmor_026884 [Zophobas morio]
MTDVNVSRNDLNKENPNLETQVKPTEQRENLTKESVQTQWKTITSKKKRPDNKPIIGSSASCNIIKSAPKKAHLHVYRLHPNATGDHLEQFLQQKLSDFQCEKLKSKHPEEYSSFKVPINFDELNKATDPELWPTGTCINRFFHKGTKSTPQT